MTDITKELLMYEAVVKLTKPSFGYWDGGAKSEFVFKPELENLAGAPAIRWGSWEANAWFVIPIGPGIKQHFAALRRRLKGRPERRITIRKQK